MELAWQVPAYQNLPNSNGKCCGTIQANRFKARIGAFGTFVFGLLLFRIGKKDARPNQHGLLKFFRGGGTTTDQQTCQ